MKRLWIVTICACATCMLILFPASAERRKPVTKSKAEIRLSKMTLEEKIAQLMIIRISSTGDENYNKSMVDLIEKYQVGGVCFFQGGPIREAILTNRIQAVSKVPLIVSIDGEWGPAMRLDSCTTFPRQMTLGALSDSNNNLIYQMGREIARQCLAVGINVNYAPCVDINNNSKNPVINSRSFGESRDKVTTKAALYLKGMQDGGITGCLKHFPGHGDTETDSHYGLPVIRKSRIELDELELYPYKKLINQDVDMIMVGHLNIPALDTAAKSVSSVSFPIVSTLLKKEFGYTGLITTDGMEMQGLRKLYPNDGDAEIKCLLAGIDLLLLPGKTDIVIQAIKNAVDSGIIPEELINERCLRVLKFKESKGLFNYVPVDISQIPQKMNSNMAVTINNSIEAKAITLLKNEDYTLPLLRSVEDTLSADSIALLCIGREEYQSQYQDIAKKYGLVYVYHEKNIPLDQYNTLLQKVVPYNRVIVAMGGTNQLAGSRYGTEQTAVTFLDELAKVKRVVFLHLGNPYALNYFGPLTNYKSIIVTYQPTPNSLESALLACFGKLVCTGTLPVSINGFPSGSGIIQSNKPQNFSSLPDSINSRIDNIINNGIKEKIFPGCVIMATHNGKTIYDKAFGYYTYDHQNAVTLQTMYDIASITKVAATTLAVMKLYDEHRFELNDKIGEYLPYLKGTNKAGITIAELLTHTSGLAPFIPFYAKIQNNESYLRQYKTPNFEIQVADNQFLRNDYPDTMRYQIAHSKLNSKKYVYSDLNFFLLKEMVEVLSKQSLDQFVADTFYTPMDLSHTCFNPLSHNFTKAEIAPTEKDVTFRKQVVQGYVHDQTAALFHGVGGNAGLFSTAEDLNKIFTMLMNGGSYEGKRYLSASTVALFTSPYEMHGCNYRGLGFSVPVPSGIKDIVPENAGPHTFGHTGFTGTSVWCDPENKLIFIFLSNRVYPNAEPNKLSKSGIRTAVQKEIYEGSIK